MWPGALESAAYAWLTPRYGLGALESAAYAWLTWSADLRFDLLSDVAFEGDCHLHSNARGCLQPVCLGDFIQQDIELVQVLVEPLYVLAEAFPGKP